MGAQSLQCGFGEGRSKRNRNAANSQDAKERKHPMGNVLHQYANAVTALNSSSLEGRSDTFGEPNDIGIGIFLKAVRVIENEGGSLGTLLHPIVDAIKNPAAGHGCISRLA